LTATAKPRILSISGGRTTALNILLPIFGSWRSRAACGSFLLLLLSGCGEKRVAEVSVPPPPSIPEASPSPTGKPSAGIGSSEARPRAEQPTASRNAKVLYSEEGMASWYGPDFNNRRGANGEVYDMDQFTAAHRTLPLGSIVRVTNVKTDQTVVVRITDRGPFVTDRVIDLSRAAAKEVDVYRHGTQKVKLEVVQAPSSIEKGGRWCVQIGAFDDPDEAGKMKSKLMRRYKTAKVLSFSGRRNDWWVRVRVPEDSKQKAQEIAKDNHTSQGAIYLVRLD
jgi:peptidoglycan lytic transglycosylase